jgi:uncharacterized protein YceK
MQSHNRILTSLIGIAVLSSVLSGCSAVNSWVQGTSKTVQTGITKPGTDATNASVRNDVQNAVIATQTYLTTNPEATTWAGLSYNPTSPKTTVTITGTWDNYQIAGHNSDTGFTYTYNSSSAQYING